MGKLFNRLINGNPDKKDFTKADLPDNRFEQFFDVIKIRFTGLLTVNLLYVLFLLPILIFGMWVFFIGLPEMGEIKGWSDQEHMEEFFAYLNSFLMICVPLYTIAGPARAGMYYVLRNWCWGEHAQARDFWVEFKRSWKTAALYNFLSSLLIYACYFWSYNAFVAQSAMPTAVRYILAAVVAILLIVYLMMDLYVYPLMVTYKLSFRQLLKNALLIALAQVPQAVACILCVGAAVILTALLWQVMAVVALLIGFVLVALAKMLLANSAFDRFNKQLTGGTAPVRRGLAPKKDKLGRVIKSGKE